MEGAVLSGIRFVLKVPGKADREFYREEAAISIAGSELRELVEARTDPTKVELIHVLCLRTTGDTSAVWR